MAAINFEPTGKQFEALNLLRDDQTNEVLYGGGARGGKSFFGCAWIIMSALSMPGSSWIIGRNELKRLKQTTLITFHEVLKHFGLSGNPNIKFDEQNGMIRFIKEDVIIFLIDLSHQPSDPNYDRLGSFGITGAFIDEAQEVHDKAINVLKGRFSNLSGEKIIKGGNTRKWKTIPKVLYTCNPAKNWIYTDFYKPWKNKTLTKTKAFVPSLVTDNPYIEPEYIDQLKTADKVTKERLLYGNFDYDDTPGRLFDYDALSDMWSNPKRTGKRYMTVDVARFGADNTVIYVWNDYVVEEVSELQRSSTVETAEEVRRLAGRYTIPMSQTIVDEDGVGGGVVDELRCRGFVNNSSAISPLSAKYRKEHKRNYANLKTQCYYGIADLVNQHKIHIIPDDFKEPLMEELDIVVQEDIDKDGPLRIIKKADVKERLGRSPDYADAFMMRFWFEINRIGEEGETVENAIDIEIYKLEQDDIFSIGQSEGVVQNEIPDSIY